MVTLARLEAQLSHITAQHNHWITNSDSVLDDSAIKTIKNLAQSCSAIVTQISTLTQRLGLTDAQLHGSYTRHVTTNENSREMAALALEQDVDQPITDENTTTDYETAKARFIANLQEQQNE